MNLDQPSAKVLALLRARITLVIGDNLERLSRGLELSPSEFSQANERLLSCGLAEEESLGDGYYRLAITDKGIAVHGQKAAIGKAKTEKKTPASLLDRAPAFLQTLMRLPLLAYRCVRWRQLRGGWLRDYFRCPPRPLRDRPIDVLVVVADHFEPSRGPGHEAAVESVRSWCAEYEQLAGRHRDADGRPPQHTWFYRFDYPNADCLRLLSESVFRGFGEVEFHLHHGYDTEGSFAATIRAGLDWFNRFGAMLTAEETPRQRFGYLAGNWSLDNGAGNEAFSGCDSEIRVLRQAGCYADFTFPAIGSRAQPRLVNRIYYASEDELPKSYDRGTEAAVGRSPSGELMMIQGPTAIDWRGGRIDDACIERAQSLDPRRLPLWLSSRVHVPGRPEWVFVKLHTHAMQNRAAFLGPAADRLFDAMEQQWNRPPYRLHYVTTREAFNIVRAAEEGQEGNAGEFRDYCIPPPANRLICCDVPWRLLRHTPQLVQLDILRPGPARIEFAGLPLERVSGHLRHIHASFRQNEIETLHVDADGPVQVSPVREFARAG
jgi:hypothetical protein